MFRFFEGRVIHIHSRNRKFSGVINELNESHSLKFKFSAIAIEAKPEIVPSEKFLRLMSAGIGADQENSTPAISATDDITPVILPAKSSEPVRLYLAKIASEYIGPIADMLVDEAFEDNDDITQAIEFIANMIPDPDQATSFRAEAGNVFDLTEL